MTGTTHRSRVPAALAAALLLQPPAAAQPQPGAERYRACLGLAREAAPRALAEALAWEEEGGGNAARHCAAAARLAMGDFREAAIAFGDLAREMADFDPARAAALHEQAGDAWLLQGGSDRALLEYGRAIGLAPGPGLFIARSAAHAAIADWHAAIDDLTRAASATPEDPLIYRLRAAALRRLDRLAEAHEDVERAIFLAPFEAENFLERGNVRRLMGNLAGARSDWRQVLRMAPGSDAADAAAANLALLGEAPP